MISYYCKEECWIAHLPTGAIRLLMRNYYTRMRNLRSYVHGKDLHHVSIESAFSTCFSVSCIQPWAFCFTIILSTVSIDLNNLDDSHLSTVIGQVL